jgi:K+-sensing histidine kinase KdpD
MTSDSSDAEAAAPDPARPGDLARRQLRAAVMLIGTAAHDLRTPLNTMAGWLQVLQAGQALPEATRERAFKGLQSAVAQQAALADGLAQIAAIHTAETNLEIGNVDIGQTLAAALKALEVEARAKGVDLECSSPAPAVVLVSDAAMVAALLRQSLAGALKFAAKNSRLSVVFAPAPAAEPAGCVVQVVLERSLLPAAGIAAILQYTQGGEGAKPNGAGAAFSFAIAQGTARFLGGSIDAGESDAGEADEAQGVSLTVRLPSQL